MTFYGSQISDHDHDGDQLVIDFDHECDGDGDGDDEFDKMLQHIREVTSDECETISLLTEKVVEEFVRYNITSGKRDCLNGKNDVDLSTCKKKRGSQDHIVFKSKKKGNNKKNGYSCSIIKSSSTEDNLKAKKKEKKTRRNDMDSDIDDKEEKGIKRITKILFPTDMNDHHDRLSMPMNQIKDFQGLLKDEEEKELSKPKTETDGLMVKLFDLASTGRTPGHNNDCVLTMRLRKWDWNMKKSCSYMLTSWKNVLNKRVLRTNDVVQIYSFRRNENLCFALIKVSDGQGCRDGAFGSSSSNTNQGNGASASSQGKINEDRAS
ncbi:unnamed protein product [Dovyalis caffra]|uniref:B3 domain-containing protein n=1 Tax=Dovyalis caffra TaxID=77055 RepID=A0AAV1R388_9ROSI|nr:unnamed protein product [Dovyalis caffra]